MEIGSGTKSETFSVIDVVVVKWGLTVEKLFIRFNLNRLRRWQKITQQIFLCFNTIVDIAK